MTITANLQNSNTAREKAMLRLCPAGKFCASRTFFDPPLPDWLDQKFGTAVVAALGRKSGNKIEALKILIGMLMSTHRNPAFSEECAPTRAGMEVLVLISNYRRLCPTEPGASE